MAKDIIVRGAQPNTKDQKVETVYIEITGCFPYSLKDEELNQVREGFFEDAAMIFDGIRSLPGGTFDQLLILMLRKTASSFIVPHNFHDEEKPNELLEALRDCADYFHDFTEQDKEETRLAAICRAAITKAEGKETQDG